ncbi:MAG: hypothetical protein ACLTJG_07865 [[Clostridium] innocuum]
MPIRWCCGCVRAPLTLVCYGNDICINAELSMVFLYAIAFWERSDFIMKFAHPIFLQVFNRYDDLNARYRNITNMRVVGI